MKTTANVMVQAITISLGVFGMAALATAQGACPNRPTLKIDFHTLDFSEKRPLCVRPNDTFRIKLKAQGDYVLDHSKISVKEKHGSIKIEKVSVNSNDVMTVSVGNFASNTEHEYMITVTGVGVLDPRVRINTSYLTLTLAQQSMDDYTLDKYEVSLADLKDIDQHFQREYHTSIAEILKSLGESSEAE